MVAGNYVVGGILFAIITLINFIVIAKGAERVSEVGARFTLDAMPGKQMSIDADFYDGQQWDAEDAEEVKSRFQMPLVFNEVAPMVDWLIGTEHRTRVDWKVLPRSEDDVKGADAKSKVL